MRKEIMIYYIDNYLNIRDRVRERRFRDGSRDNELTIIKFDPNFIPNYIYSEATTEFLSELESQTDTYIE